MKLLLCALRCRRDEKIVRGERSGSMNAVDSARHRWSFRAEGPVWSGQFTPFGQETVAGQVLGNNIGNPQPGDGTTMHYKFTGKERDSE
jgi:hypothetical protein